MGRCIYRFNPSEHYQRTPPGCAPETHCGAETYPIYDEPELVYRLVQAPDGSTAQHPVESGVLLPRREDDPYCPEHGGTPKPDENTIHMFLQREFDRRRSELEAIGRQLASGTHSAVEQAVQNAITAQVVTVKQEEVNG